MALLGFKKSLTQDDMWDLPSANKTETIYSKFRRYFDEAVGYTFDVKPKYQSGKLNQFEEYSRLRVNILIPLIKAFWPQLATCMVIKFSSSFLTFGNPILLDYLITFTGSDQLAWKGYVLAFGMAACSLTESMLNGQYEFLINVTAMRMRSAVIAAVYRKVSSSRYSMRSFRPLNGLISLSELEAIQFWSQKFHNW